MKLYVGNLSFDTTENDLQDQFAQFGKVVEAALVQDRETGLARRTAQWLLRGCHLRRNVVRSGDR